VTMDFTNVPLGEIIRYVCMGSGLDYCIDDHAVIIIDQKRGAGKKRQKKAAVSLYS